MSLVMHIMNFFRMRFKELKIESLVKHAVSRAESIQLLRGTPRARKRSLTKPASLQHAR